ncbi:MAG: hypothetical protein LC109_00850 [Bacteroidia bacterium]|nr:hypothetical protein [Bacteroidia bacterium]MCO5253188.1 hypothetical protein [Bacteroidota bacterium]MCZ2128799.1 hypothetical protein [Bacteroidia bacterium]
MTQSIKTEAGILALAIVLYVSMSVFHMSSLLYIAYVLLAGLFFFPGKLLLTKEKMKIDMVLSFLLLCHTVTFVFVLSGEWQCKRIHENNSWYIHAAEHCLCGIFQNQKR